MKSTRGFTLIELLIVIALLGALAIGLLATIDPFEQIKKGRDTSTRNTVSEFYNANLRYYATKAQFPWGTGGVGPTSLNDMGTAITSLQDAGELKTKFMDLAGTGNLAKIFLTSTAADDIAVCYNPESKGFRNDPNTVYTQNAGSGVNCLGTGGTSTGCYWCIR
jgi:prepilin-type N-terminal cleavage/methylation domain-containing protein